MRGHRGASDIRQDAAEKAVPHGVTDSRHHHDIRGGYKHHD